MNLLNRFFKKNNKLFNRFRYWLWKSRLKALGKKSKIWSGVIMYSPESIEIGYNTGIGNNVVIWGGGGVKIGNDVLIAANTVIASETHSPKAQKFVETHVKKPIKIEDNVWIGASCVVLQGVTVGKNSIVGAGSVVTKDVSEGVIVAGNPAKLIKKRFN